MPRLRQRPFSGSESSSLDDDADDDGANDAFLDTDEQQQIIATFTKQLDRSRTVFKFILTFISVMGIGFFLVRMVEPFGKPFCPLETFVNASSMGMLHLLSAAALVSVSFGIIHSNNWKRWIYISGICVSVNSALWLYVLLIAGDIFPMHLAWTVIVTPIFMGVAVYVRRGLEKTLEQIYELKGHMYQYKAL